MHSFLIIHAVCLLFLVSGTSESDYPLTNSSVHAELQQIEPEPQPKVCDAGGKGFLFPLLDNEHEWPSFVRGLCYAVGLIYCFYGVSIIADIFMSAIEAITSRRTQIVDDYGEVRTVFNWNDTVANLSLMALGSSAPEIFLSIIDLVRRQMYAGELGPSTIVGSAAFNLLVIVAVCVVCIPYPESRQIEQMEVFCLTAFFSVLAYFWMAFILTISSPNEVEWWEAAVTLLLLPILIWMAYRVDTLGWFGLLPHQLRPHRNLGEDIDRQSSPDYLPSNEEEASEGRREEPADPRRVSFAQKAHVATSSFASVSAASKSGSVSFDDTMSTGSSHSRGRKNLTRRKSIAQFHNMAMSRAPGKAYRTQSFTIDPAHSFRTSTCSRVSLHGLIHEGGEERVPSVQFLVDRQSMPEDIEQKVIKVCRKEIGYKMCVHYKIELLAEVHTLPMPYRSAYDIAELNLANSSPEIATLVSYGQLVMPATGFEKEFIVNAPKAPKGACKDFLVSLISAEVQFETEEDEKEQVGKGSRSGRSGIGRLQTTQVDVRPFKDPGCLAFIRQSITVPGKSEDFALKVVVLRKGACVGTVSCTYCTEALDAVPGYDYREAQGHLTFSEGVTEQVIEVDIFGKSLNRGTYKFLVCLKPSTPDSCVFDPAEDGGADSAILTIQIDARAADQGTYDTLGRKFDNFFNTGMLSTAGAEWKDHIFSIWYCNGSADSQKSATMQDWLFHVFTLPWQILFLVVPPTTYGGGWVCFCVSLLVIAAVTAVIADFAELFGCIVGIGDMMTAITFVALGTSMPDLLASKIAATEDTNADASIINVTGSNAVNVFLGLGLPWTAATIYWALRGDLRSEWEQKYPEMAETHKIGCVFVVPSDNLGFCVLAFSLFALLAISVLVFRRWKLGCELGGPSIPKVITTFSLVFMWFGYVFLASWRFARWDVAQTSEIILVIAVTCVVELVVASGVVISGSKVDMDGYNEEKAIYEATQKKERKEENESAEEASRRSIDSQGGPLDGSSTAVSLEISAERPHGLVKASAAEDAAEPTNTPDAHSETDAAPTNQALFGPKLVPKARRQYTI